MAELDNVGGNDNHKAKNPSSNPDSLYYVHLIDYSCQMHVNDSLNDNNYAD